MKTKLFILPLVALLMIGCKNKQSKSFSIVESSDSISESEVISSDTSESSEISSSESESSESSSSSEEIIEHETYDYDGYYEGLEWENSDDLINKLHTIISADYTSLKYEGNWATNQGADQSLTDFESVDLLYSFDTDLKTNTYANGRGWQREHAFAASLMTGFTSGDAVGVHQGRATDFHNLFAATYSGNTSRGNKNFGVANTEDATYQDFGSYTFDSKNFEPADKDKGKVSRAIFYMAVMYNQIENETVKVTLNYSEEDKITYGKASTTVPIPVTYQPLKVVEDYVSYNKYTYTNWYYKTRNANMTDEQYADMLAKIEQYGEGADGYADYSMENCQFAIGNLSTLLEWGMDYPVDYLEMQHNTYVYSESGQGNRNPFVDYPELISYAFGDKKDVAGSLDDLDATYYELEMDHDEIEHYAIKTAKRQYDEGSTFTQDDYEIVGYKKNLTTTPASYTDTTPEYTFTKADAELGKKQLTINTPINNLLLNVIVNAGSIDSCSYQGGVIDAGKSNFSRGGVTNVDGVSWLVNWTNSTGAMGNKDSTYGLAFGVASGGKTMHELTFETTNSVTINKVFFKGSCKAGETITVTIKVGDTTVSTNTITRISGTTIAPEVVGASFASTSGKVKIIINGSGATNGAIYVHTLAFNEITD